MRIAQGFDLHHLSVGKPFKLGGVLIDWPKGPVGHSDGDVLLHAVIDALLGAAGLGDIGEWFPPTSESFKDADSSQLLKKVLEALQIGGWQIINVDTTILLETPKLSTYKAPIQEHLAQLLGIERNCISIKAKTMEGLGPIGQAEAIAAFAVVLITQK